MRFLTNHPRAGNEPCIAQVSFSDSAGFGAVGDAERRGIPVFAPRGMSFQPCEGDNILLLPVEGGMACLGALCRFDGLLAGELRLSSSGGAVIELKNNGDVKINGLTVTKSGKLVESAG